MQIRPGRTATPSISTSTPRRLRARTFSTVTMGGLVGWPANFLPGLEAGHDVQVAGDVDGDFDEVVDLRARRRRGRV